MHQYASAISTFAPIVPQPSTGLHRPQCHRAGQLLAVHFPAGAKNPNELPDSPLVM